MSLWSLPASSSRCPGWPSKLTIRSLRQNSITALVLLLIPAVMLSHLAHLNTYDARLGGIEMAKACLLFLLVVGLVNSSRRLLLILWVVTVCVVFQAFLAVLQYRGLLHLPALQNIVQTSYDLDTDEPIVLVRLCGIGVFNDPNDFSLILVVAMVVCACGLGERRLGRARLLLFGTARTSGICADSHALSRRDPGTGGGNAGVSARPFRLAEYYPAGMRAGAGPHPIALGASNPRRFE